MSGPETVLTQFGFTHGPWELTRIGTIDFGPAKGLSAFAMAIESPHARFEIHLSPGGRQLTVFQKAGRLETKDHRAFWRAFAAEDGAA